jgi:hypothetical protein
MDLRLLRTQFAAQAASFAETFRSAVEDFPVGEHRGEMTAPEASTGGGVQALQHIRLVPPAGHGRTYVVGNANPAQKMAELRSLAYVDGVSIVRFGEPSGLDRQAYAAFTDRAAQFLEMLDFTVIHAAHPPPTRSSQPNTGPSSVIVFAFIVWSLALLAVGMVLGVLARQHGWIR